MKHSSRNSLDHSARPGGWWLAAVCVLLAAGTGCESFQKKFTRKPKASSAQKPTPVISFQDYSRALTPADRYRKHYMLFDYWHTQLVDALDDAAMNPKRLKRNSQDALAELRILRTLVTDDVGAALDPIIEERESLNRQIQQEAVSASRAPAVVRILQAHMDRIHRDFFWRDVENHLKPADAGTP